MKAAGYTPMEPESPLDPAFDLAWFVEGILFVVEGVITLCALIAYLKLTPQDGAHVSGHGAQMNME